jgi:hypothetical protein
MGVSGQHHAPAALYPGKEPPVPILQEAGWAPEPVWTQGLEENPLPLSGIMACSGIPLPFVILFAFVCGLSDVGTGSNMTEYYIFPSKDAQT